MTKKSDFAAGLMDERTKPQGLDDDALRTIGALWDLGPYKRRSRLSRFLDFVLSLMGFRKVRP